MPYSPTGLGSSRFLSGGRPPSGLFSFPTLLLHQGSTKIKKFSLGP